MTLLGKQVITKQPKSVGRYLGGYLARSWMRHPVSEYDTSGEIEEAYIYGNFIDEPLYMTNNEGGYYYFQKLLCSPVFLYAGGDRDVYSAK